MSLVGPLRSVMRIWSLQKSYFLYYQPCFSHEFGATEIAPRLWLGGIRDSFDIENLQKRDITHVLTMIVGVPPWYPDRLQYLNHDLMDLSVENILPCFSQESFDFIDRGIESGGVLVHCMKGKSRSASMVLAYLMRENGWSLKETLDYVQEKRPLVQPNEGFLEQLRQFEKNHSLQEKKER